VESVRAMTSPLCAGKKRTERFQQNIEESVSGP
jgi:hypothetical protein